MLNKWHYHGIILYYGCLISIKLLHIIIKILMNVTTDLATVMRIVSIFLDHMNVDAGLVGQGMATPVQVKKNFESNFIMKRMP